MGKNWFLYPPTQLWKEFSRLHFYKMTWFERFLTRHLGGVPKKLSDLQWLLRVNPTHPPTLTEAHTFRTISPASQPPYSPPVNDTISKNYYYKRDTRRQYPRPVELDKLLTDKRFY